MDLETAIMWANATAALGVYGKSSSWGIYTKYYDDARIIAKRLFPEGPSVPEANPGEYLHFHPASKLFFGKYSHFHVWYGLSPI